MAILDRTLPIAQRFRDRSEQAEQLTTRGYIAYRRRHYRQALRDLDQAIDLATDMGRPLVQAQALNHAGTARRAASNPDAAEAAHRHALLLARQLDEPYEQARALEGMARVCHDRGKSRRGDQYWRAALRMYRDLEVPEARRIAAYLVP